MTTVLSCLCAMPPGQTEEVLAAYLRSRPEGWPVPMTGQCAKAFFTEAFHLHSPGDDTSSLITGYYEPEIEARLAPDPVFAFPLFRLPPDPHHDQAAIMAGALAGRGLEIAYLSDPVERFFLQVQGSGRLRLPDGGMIRVGFAGQNGYPYRSLGRVMVERGLIPESGISADAMREWFTANPGRINEILLLNPSWVYFRELQGLAPEEGPIGTAGVPLAAMISLAVDPDHIPLGAPVLLETEVGGTLFRRLMVAQDTGGAIKGPQRADLFFGTGLNAGHLAGRQKASGRLTVLLPGAG